ncbi:MAG TPA: hypothetical protein VFY41_01235 [Nitrososphaeraceae archaeon]|nr:hypothetical protein [Nitrososphaeraceae archaeon]
MRESLREVVTVEEDVEGNWRIITAAFKLKIFYYMKKNRSHELRRVIASHSQSHAKSILIPERHIFLKVIDPFLCFN